MRRSVLALILVCLITVPTFKLAAQGSGRTYTVQTGDTLYSISVRFGTSIEAIMAANHITDSDLIYPGQVLKIPGNGGSSNAVPTVPPSAAAVASAPSGPLPAGDYVVQAGDSLARIAERFGTSVAAIQAANHLSDPDMISVGQVLHVPGAPQSGPAAPANAAAAVVPVGSVSNFPVVPAISGAVYSHARAIIAVGKRQGNRLNVFSKVGDSITASPYFLAPIGLGALRIGSYSGLQSSVNFFSQAVARTHNSFANLSLAARAGWTSADPLNAGLASPGVCQAGETPLDCELRVVHPSVALIMFGTNDVASIQIDAFRTNLNTMITICENHGVIPVLSTALAREDNPAFAGRIDSYNAVIAQTAIARSVPLWNYWAATVGLPNHGLAGDKIHPSVPGDQNTCFFDNDHLSAGTTMRNLTAVQVLNALYTTVLR